MSAKAAARPAQTGHSYMRVAQALISDIESGRYPVGSLLPTEHELAAQFGMSRHTMREALRQLFQLGLITRQQGVGSRVMAQTATLGYVQRAATIADLLNYARDVELRANTIDEVIADESLAERLLCRVGQRWLRLTGLRFQQGDPLPICHVEVFIAYEFATVRDLLGRSNTAIYRLLEDQFGVTFTEVQQTIGASGVPDEMAALLDAEAGSPALEIGRYYRTSDGRLAEAAFSLYPAGRFTYEVRLTLDQPGGRT